MEQVSQQKIQYYVGLKRCTRYILKLLKKDKIILKKKKNIQIKKKLLNLLYPPRANGKIGDVTHPKVNSKTIFKMSLTKLKELRCNPSRFVSKPANTL